MSDGIRSGVNCTRPQSRPSSPRGRLDQLGLGEARRADQQRVAAGEDGGQRQLDDAVLSEHDLADLGADLRQELDGRVGLLDDIGGWGVGDCGFTHVGHLPMSGAHPMARPPMSNAKDPKATSLLDLIATLQLEAGLEKPRSLPPVHLWNPGQLRRHRP